jgi:hypothetical protein
LKKRGKKKRRRKGRRTVDDEPQPKQYNGDNPERNVSSTSSRRLRPRISSMKPWLPCRSFPSRTTQSYLRTLNLRPKPTDILKIASESHPEPEPERTRTRYTITPRIVEIPAPREKRSKQEEREILERVTRIEDTKSRPRVKRLEKVHRTDAREWTRSWARGPIHREWKAAVHKAVEKTDKRE